MTTNWLNKYINFEFIKKQTTATEQQFIFFYLKIQQVSPEQAVEASVTAILFINLLFIYFFKSFQNIMVQVVPVKMSQGLLIVLMCQFCLWNSLVLFFFNLGVNFHFCCSACKIKQKIICVKLHSSLLLVHCL